MTGVPNQGRVKFQDEKELFDFVTGGGNGATAIFGVGGGGALRKLNTAVTLAADTSTQSVFGASKGQFSVEAGKTYQFQGLIQVNTGSTTHTTSFGFVLASATLANVRAHVITNSAADGTPVAPLMANLEVATQTVINTTRVAVETGILVWGSFDCTASGTVQPASAFSANPGGTNTVELGTTFTLRALGPSTIEKFGAVT